MFLDTVIKENSCLQSEYCSSEGESDISESDDDVSYSSSSTNNSDCEEDLNPNLDQFDVSYDDDFLAHTSETPESNPSESCAQPIDMDITSELEPVTIELDVPVEDMKRLIPENYCKEMAKDLSEEITFVKEKRFVGDSSKVKELFKSCLEKDCNALIQNVKESFVGCALKINWQCADGHSGDWHSSKLSKKLYINNLLLASSLLFSGNNFTKISLLAKCLNLAFFSKTTF